MTRPEKQVEHGTKDEPAVERYQPLQTVHLIAHPDCKEAEALGERLFTTLFENHRDLTAHGLRIPVRIWRTADLHVPQLRTADTSVIVVLIDSYALDEDGWTDALGRLTTLGPASEHLVLPVALSDAAIKRRSPVSGLNWIRWSPASPDPAPQRVLNQIYAAIYRHLEKHGLTVFVSHAKKDGEPLAQQARQFLHHDTGIGDWFDAQDLPSGHPWERAIDDAARRNLMLVVRSSAYATREWCRIEVLAAKRAGAPVVVLDALEDGEDRAFPYLGNGPVARWHTGDDWERVLGVILMEALRFSFFPRRVAQLGRFGVLSTADTVFSRPPELLTLLATRAVEPDNRRLVYPDPPLGTEERKLVASLAPGVRSATPAQLLAGTDLNGDEPPLAGKVVGMSVSSSPLSDLAARGLTPSHLTHVFVEIARQLLAAGATLVYGGDLRAGGFTTTLADLLHTYPEADRPARDRVKNYQHWPLSSVRPGDAEGEGLDDLLAVATRIKVGAAGDDLPVGAKKAASLTRMREEMTAVCNARIVVGGKVDGYSGRMPGVAEEALLASAAATPIYILSGFGGCAAQLADIVAHPRPDALGLRERQATDPQYAALLADLGDDPDDIDRRLVQPFGDAGPAGLVNNLTPAENTALMTSTDIDQVVALLLRGLAPPLA